MEDGFFVSLISSYGPLALGWPFCWYFVRQNGELQKRLLDISIANVAVNTEVKGAVQALSEFIKTRIER